MIGKYPDITLCGSTRFKEQFLETQKRLTLEGNIVISVGLFGHSGDDEVQELYDAIMTEMESVCSPSRSTWKHQQVSPMRLPTRRMIGPLSAHLTRVLI